MGLFRRRRKPSEPTEEELFAVDRLVSDARAVYQTEDGFDLRKLAVDSWEGAVTSSMDTVKADLHPENWEKTGEGFYGGELARHWEGLDQTERDAELLQLIQFVNAFRDRTDASDPRVQATFALVDEKIRLLAIANDGVYGGNYSRRIYSDPGQFGALELPA